ncbi:hypothetical protein Tco_0521729 [Tanacetum coccineum]
MVENGEDQGGDHSANQGADHSGEWWINNGVIDWINHGGEEACVDIVWKLLVHQVIIWRILKLGRVASETVGLHADSFS